MSLYFKNLRYKGTSPVIKSLGYPLDAAIYKGTTIGEEVVTPPSPAVDYSTQYFTIESLEDDNTITFSKSSLVYSPYYWSTDGGSTWTSYKASASQTLNTGDKLLMKCTCNYFAKKSGGNVNYSRFSSTKTFNVYGNIMSLLYGDDFVGQTSLKGDYSFYRLFYNCSNIISAENLIMPATTLTQYCYWSMFNGCSKLSAAPMLPATTLVAYCYEYMFSYCRLVSSITCLATDRSATECTSEWLTVAASGTFYKNPLMSSWPSGSSGIPSGWTVVDYAG